MHEQIKKDFNQSLNHWQMGSYESYRTYLETNGEELSNRAGNRAKTSVVRLRLSFEGTYESRDIESQERYLWHPCYQGNCI